MDKNHNIHEICSHGERYSSVQQLYRRNGDREEPIFPRTVLQSIHDGRTGATLEDILKQFNDIFLTYQGSPEATRNLLPPDMRRKGITISYVDMKGDAIRERAISSMQLDNDHWGLSSNWTTINELSIGGEISVSAEGTWIINGEDTGVAAVGPKGNNGLTPWFKTINNKLCFSYDEETWEESSDYIAAWFRWTADARYGEDVGRIEITRDGETWEELSPLFVNRLKILGVVTSEKDLPTNAAVGEIYSVGPTYESSDTRRSNPIYDIYVNTDDGWVDCGRMTNNVIFNDAGTLDTSKSYGIFEFVTTEDSCYLSLYDNNSGADYLDSTKWKCIANGKPATLAAERANTAADAANSSRTAIEKNESARITAENERITAENARITAENSRIVAEDERISAEAARKEAESQRVSESSEAVKGAVSAASSANAAARSANTAASKVTSAVADITAEKEAAIGAAANADAAAARVTAAITDITTEKAAALDAATKADAAANNANASAIEANKQAERAKEQADNPPKQGENGNWWQWDDKAGEYVDTGILAKGGVLYPSFYVDDDMQLIMNYQDEVAAEQFVLNEETGHLNFNYR
jgi:hypothetical protein